MTVKRVLFETAFGDWLLARVEAFFGVVVVPLEDLEAMRVRPGPEPVGIPTAVLVREGPRYRWRKRGWRFRPGRGVRAGGVGRVVYDPATGSWAVAFLGPSRQASPAGPADAEVRP